MNADLIAIAQRIESQADCLEKYAEQSGHKAKPVPSVFHLQASHFREIASDVRILSRFK